MKEEKKADLYQTLEIIDATVNEPTKEALKKAFQEATAKSDSLKFVVDNAKGTSKTVDKYNDLIQSISASSQVPEKNVSEALQKFSKVLVSAEMKGILKREEELLSSITPSLQLLGTIVDKNRYNMYEMAFLKEPATRALFKDRISQIGITTSLDKINKGTIDRFKNWPNLYFDRTAEKFVTEGQEETELSVNDANVISAGANFFDNIEKDCVTDKELADFMSYLEMFPTMALKYEVAKKIERLVCKVVPRMDFDHEFFYHSRAKESQESAPYTYYDMLCAPKGVTTPGRFNHPGQAFYYFADSKEGAETEIHKHDRDAILQTAKIRKIKTINMIDLSGTIKQAQMFLRYLRFQKGDGDSKMPREYLIPCFVSDCCRANGIEGIKYYGSEKYMNYVCWNTGYFEFVEMCE